MTTSLTAVEILRIFILALATFREARGEPLEGKIYVAQTIENRVNDDRWPNDYESVILQPWQFSAFNRSDPNVTTFPKIKHKYDMDKWLDCVAVAKFVIESPSRITKANHYYAYHIDPPDWAKGHEPVARVGVHLFFEL